MPIDLTQFNEAGWREEITTALEKLGITIVDPAERAKDKQIHYIDLVELQPYIIHFELPDERWIVDPSLARETLVERLRVFPMKGTGGVGYEETGRFDADQPKHIQATFPELEAMTLRVGGRVLVRGLVRFSDAPNIRSRDDVPSMVS
jgi:hypothetical protein